MLQMRYIKAISCTKMSLYIWMGIKTMTDFNDYSLFNIWGGNYCLPQNNFTAINSDRFFNLWNNYSFSNFIPSFTPRFSLFDFSFNNFSFPKIDFSQPLFNFSNIAQPFVQIKPTILNSPHIATTTKKDDDKISLEPAETDFEVAETEIKHTKKAKTKKAEKSLDRSIYVAEEIVNGYYIQKAKYSNITNIKPYMKEALVKMDKKAKELGYTMVIVDGYRSHATQVDLKKRKPKLAASPGKSAHEYGVAVDVALFKNGERVKDIKKEVPEFGNYAQSLGMDWGATWKSKYEPWHFNLDNWHDLADVRDEYRKWNNLA